MRRLLNVSTGLLLAAFAIAPGCSHESRGGAQEEPCPHICETFDNFTVHCSSFVQTYQRSFTVPLSEVCAWARSDAADGGIAGAGGAGAEADAGSSMCPPPPQVSAGGATSGCPGYYDVQDFMGYCTVEGECCTVVLEEWCSP